MIKIDGLCRQYGDFKAVDKVSFTIVKGEVIGLLGHNGAGKTTIMKMITGFLEPNAGTIEIDGLMMPEQRMAIQGRIGYLPENCPVYPEMTVIDYLEYAADLRGLTDQAKLLAVQSVINQTELASKATHMISTLSRGFRQRVGVAQAILNQPEIMILDEPTNGLDPSQISHMRELIVTLSKTSTVIISTHVLQEVQAVCDRVLIVKNGKLAIDAKISDLQKGSTLKLVSTSSSQQIAQALNQLPCKLTSSSSLSGQQFEHIIEADKQEDNVTDLVNDVVKSLIDNNLTIFAIYPERQDLESIFRQVNAVETDTPQEVKANAA
ncbi:MAG: ABC transporter ATP-binding protein [Methylococcaceae bacterium]